MKNSKHFFGAISILILSFSLITSVTLFGGIATPSVQAAVSHFVQGQLNTRGNLVQYSKVRTHTYEGAIRLNVTDMPYGYLRLGLRDVRYKDGRQLAGTVTWYAKGSKSFGTFKKGTRFAIQGRMQKAPGRDNTWGGNLSF